MEFHSRPARDTFLTATAKWPSRGRGQMRLCTSQIKVCIGGEAWPQESWPVLVVALFALLTELAVGPLSVWLPVAVVFAIRMLAIRNDWNLPKALPQDPTG